MKKKKIKKKFYNTQQEKIYNFTIYNYINYNHIFCKFTWYSKIDFSA